MSIQRARVNCWVCRTYVAAEMKDKALHARNEAMMALEHSANSPVAPYLTLDLLLL